MPENDSAAHAAPLWDVDACASYLNKSRRWIWLMIARTPEQPGSIPHVRIGRSPRFIPDDIVDWVRGGCPPAAVFRQWQAAEEKRCRRN